MVTSWKTKARVTTTSNRRQPQDPESLVKKFCKMILPSTMKSNMMRIPPRFVKLHGSKLSDVVTLETPAGFKRSIKLKRIGKEIWLREGWTEFAKAHSIERGHFLMFEYIENSSFRVIIFDVSASEINYPLDAVDISDSDDEVIDVTDKVFLGSQCASENYQCHGGYSEHQPKGTERDIDFNKILHELDVMSSVQVLNEEEKDKRAYKG